MPTASPVYVQVRQPAQNLTDSQIKVTPARVHFEWRAMIGGIKTERLCVRRDPADQAVLDKSGKVTARPRSTTYRWET